MVLALEFRRQTLAEGEQGLEWQDVPLQQAGLPLEQGPKAKQKGVQLNREEQPEAPGGEHSMPRS